MPNFSLFGLFNGTDFPSIIAPKNLRKKGQPRKVFKPLDETELLAVTAPQTLRDLPHVRQDTADRAAALLASMTATYGKSVLA